MRILVLLTKLKLLLYVIREMSVFAIFCSIKIALIKLQYFYAKFMMMKKCNNYKYPSVLECALKLWRCLCAKYFDKQTHILVRNAIMLFLCRRRVRGKGCRGIILLTSWLMVHHACLVKVLGSVVSPLYAKHTYTSNTTSWQTI